MRREINEETGLDVEVGPLVEVFDRVHRDADGRVRYHFVIVDYLCTRAGGDAVRRRRCGGRGVGDGGRARRYGVNAHAAR